MAFKTKANWKGDLKDYLKVGDYVDQEMADYFVNELPPATFSALLIQMGEPYSHINGRATYPTLKKTSEGWQYIGHCFRGQCETVD